MGFDWTSRLRKHVSWPVLTGMLLVGWVGGISYSHRSLERAGRSNKGAGELLQIGALPVT
jgi:hypothetical protein